MSVSSSKSNPHAAYVEDYSDSQDEKSDKRPPPNSARKVTRRDEASDSGYSSKTHATESSSQSTKAVKPTKPAKQSTPQKLKTMAKKVTVAAKKSASKDAKDAKEVKEAAPAPAEAKRRPSILKQPKGSSDLRRRSFYEVEDQETAARMKLSGEPVHPRRASTARPKIEGYAKPPPQTVAAPPPANPIPAQSITIPKPQSRPVTFALQPRPRPHSYHPGMTVPTYMSRSVPIHTTPYPYPPHQTFLVPVHPQPQPQSTPQPMPHMQRLPPPPQPPPQARPPQHAQPPPHQGGNVYVMPSGPSSPRSTINYNFPPTQIPQQQQTYFQPNPSQQGYWQSTSYQRDPAARRMSASFIQPRDIPEYPQIPQPSRIQHQHQPPPSHIQPQHPPQPRPSYHPGQDLYHEPMVRTPSHGRPPPNHHPQGHHAPYQETFYMDDFEDDNEEYEYEDPYEMEMRRTVDERAARARIAMPPPPRPPLYRSDTTSVVHRSGSQRHHNRGSIDFSLPSPTRRSLEGTRPLISTHTNGSGRPSYEPVYVPEAPPSPNTLRRRSRPVSFQEYENQERSAEAYQYLLATGQSPHPTREDLLEDTEKALTRRISRAKNGVSDTTSRASSRSDKKSKRGDRHRYDDETLTLQMNGMTLGVRGNKGTVNIKMADGESKSRSVSRSQTYHASEGTGPETEVHRNSRTRSRSAAVPQEPVPNSAISRLKNNSKTTSRRSSSSRAAPQTPANERMEYTGIPGY